MSLRKSACLTPRRLDAARRNSQRSTGPRSPGGKERVKMNAVKHGCDAAPENEAAVMRALGEDPGEFAALQGELSTTYGPGDALWDCQLADLAGLYWRRQRLARMQAGLMRRALEALEERRRGLARALADVTFQPSQCEAVAFELPKPNHPLVRLRMLISLLTVIREQVRRRSFSSSHRYQINSYYKDELGWRPRQISDLLMQFENWAYRCGQQNPEELDQYVRKTFGNQAGLEARCQELLRLLEDQIAAVEAAFGEEMQAQERKDAIERDACLAPEGETWERLLRQEMALDRSIDRKVRIILALRKEHARADGGAGDSGQDPEPQPSLRETQTPNGRGLGQPVSATNQGTENAGENSESAEQSQNVIENKEPDAEEVAA